MLVNQVQHTIWEVRTADHAFLHSVTVAGRPSAIAVGPSGVWIVED